IERKTRIIFPSVSLPTYLNCNGGATGGGGGGDVTTGGGAVLPSCPEPNGDWAEPVSGRFGSHEVAAKISSASALNFRCPNCSTCRRPGTLFLVRALLAADLVGSTGCTVSSMSASFSSNHATASSVAASAAAKINLRILVARFSISTMQIKIQAKAHIQFARFNIFAL